MILAVFWWHAYAPITNTTVHTRWHYDQRWFVVRLNGYSQSNPTLVSFIISSSSLQVNPIISTKLFRLVFFHHHCFCSLRLCTSACRQASHSLLPGLRHPKHESFLVYATSRDFSHFRMCRHKLAASIMPRQLLVSPQSSFRFWRTNKFFLLSQTFLSELLHVKSWLC